MVACRIYKVNIRLPNTLSMFVNVTPSTIADINAPKHYIINSFFGLVLTETMNWLLGRNSGGQVCEKGEMGNGGDLFNPENFIVDVSTVQIIKQFP